MANVSKIRILRSKNKKDWYYHGLAKNGKVVVSARGYNTKFNAVRAATKSFPEAVIMLDEV